MNYYFGNFNLWIHACQCLKRTGIFHMYFVKSLLQNSETTGGGCGKNRVLLLKSNPWKEFFYSMLKIKGAQICLPSLSALQSFPRGGGVPIILQGERPPSEVASACHICIKFLRINQIICMLKMYYFWLIDLCCSYSALFT